MRIRWAGWGTQSTKYASQAGELELDAQDPIKMPGKCTLVIPALEQQTEEDL